jgi:tetratricopeptide (TPR) repeat protein
MQRARSRGRRWAILAAVVVALGVAATLGWRTYERGEVRDRGLELAKQDNFTAAEPLLKQAVEHDPDDVDVIRALALGYTRQARVPEAIAALDRWQALRPDEQEPVATRFRLRIRQRLYDDAVSDAKQLLAFTTADPDVFPYMADVFRRAGRPADTEAAARAGLRVRPNDSGLRFQLAETLHAQGRLPAARDQLDELTRDDPRFEPGWRLRGIVTADGGDPAAALPLLEKAMTLDPTDTAARYHLGLALGRLGRTDDARRELDKYDKTRTALDLAGESYNEPDNLDLAVRAAAAQFSAGLDARGNELLNRVLSQDPKHPGALKLRAEHGPR